jgi:hypothetical protein
MRSPTVRTMRSIAILVICSVASLTACDSDKESQPSSSHKRPPTQTLTITSVVGQASPSAQPMIKIAEAIRGVVPDAEEMSINCRRPRVDKRRVCDVNWVTSGGSHCKGTFNVYLDSGGAVVDSRSSALSLCNLG